MKDTLNIKFREYHTVKDDKSIQYRLSKMSIDDFTCIPEVYSDSFNDKPWKSDWYNIPEFDIDSNWIVKIDDFIVGFLISFLSKEIPYISVVAVRKSSQGLGIASKLIEECISYWKLKKFNEVRIHVDHDRKKTRNLYEKLSFKVIKEREEDAYMCFKWKI